MMNNYIDNIEYFRDRENKLLSEVEFDDNLCEFEQNSQPPILKGRLKSCLGFWESINTNSFIIDIIRCGYRIPFIDTPCRSILSNNKSALEHAEFVESAILELVSIHSVVEVPFVPHVVNPLSVSIQSSGKKTLILDLRHVNKCVWKQKIKFEDWRFLVTYLNKGYFLFNFDLKSGYHHIEIFPDHQTFLGFSWTFSGITKYYCFSVLPFGLSSAPFIFTKCIRPLVKFWRFNGVKIVVYLDDGCGSAESSEVAQGHSTFVRSTLRNAGFVVNNTKSQWEPVQSLVWLGLNWDLVSGTFYITNNRIVKFLEIIDQFLGSAPYVTARDCATITGHILSMSSVIGNLTRLKTRYIYKVIESRYSWNTRFDIGIHNDSLAEIFFWKNNIISLNCRNISEYQIPRLRSYSDTSKIGCGAYLVGTDAVSYRMWEESEASKSSTWRELKAIEFALSSFVHLIKAKSVKWHSDNQSAVRILEIGSPKDELHTIAVNIFSFCRVNNISLLAMWIPRELNAQADGISKFVDYDDWTTTPEFFAYLDNIWGPYTVDRFANSDNRRLSRFNSRFFVPGTEAVDAFSISWAGENNWLVPPVHCVIRVMKHMISCRASGTLVVPYWPSNVFWPFLFSDAYNCQPYVIGILQFQSAAGIFRLGRYRDSLIGSDKFTSQVLA